ncbi:MAG: metallophosphoesterase [Proteobacteria bacterium]|nr:metallophosphoesterase [Pseudomonadota bacterium]
MLRKIKLVVSDLHLGRGYWREDGSRNPLEDFNHDEQFSELLEYYSAKEYRGSEAELIINGDFANLLEGTGEDNPEIISEGVALNRLEAVFRGHPRFFEALREFVNREHHSIRYIIGNHDCGFYYPRVKRALDQRLATKAQYVDFVCSFDGFLLEHGHQHHPSNWYNPRRMFLTKSLPEPILNLPWGGLFVLKVLNPIKLQRPYVDKIRPFGAYIRWGLFNDLGFTLGTMMKIAYYFVTLNFIHPFWRESRIRMTWNVLKQITVQPDLDGAAREILRRSRYHTVIFGHTHQYRHVQFWKNKEYLNIGTWIDNISLDVENLGRNVVLSYILIDYPEPSSVRWEEDEKARPRAKLKAWQGHWRITKDLA